MTGGIGGVHRTTPSPASYTYNNTSNAVSHTWDVSADLVELGRSPGVAVVSAGVKSILDVPATLEYLETLGKYPRHRA